jgi:hypothetical protein
MDKTKYQTPGYKRFLEIPEITNEKSKTTGVEDSIASHINLADSPSRILVNQGLRSIMKGSANKNVHHRRSVQNSASRRVTFSPSVDKNRNEILKELPVGAEIVFPPVPKSMRNSISKVNQANARRN